MFFVIPKMPSKTLVMVLKKRPDLFNRPVSAYDSSSDRSSFLMLSSGIHGVDPDTGTMDTMVLDGISEIRAQSLLFHLCKAFDRIFFSLRGLISFVHAQQALSFHLI